MAMSSRQGSSKLLTTLLSLFLAVQLPSLVSGLSFKDQCLKWTNHFRKLHQAGPLIWSNDLAEKAQKFANESAAANKFSNDGSSNVFLTPNNPSELCTRAVQYIYEEEKRYDYDNPGYSFYTGHFTLMVWNKSTEMGVGFAVNDTVDKRWVILKYKPMGNIAGQFRDNVFPPLLPLCNATLDSVATRAPCRWPPSSATSLMVPVWLVIAASILGINLGEHAF